MIDSSYELFTLKNTSLHLLNLGASPVSYLSFLCFFLLSPQRSRQTRAETLATQSKTAGDLLTASESGWWWGEKKINGDVLYFSFSRARELAKRKIKRRLFTG